MNTVIVAAVSLMLTAGFGFAIGYFEGGSAADGRWAAKENRALQNAAQAAARATERADAANLELSRAKIEAGNQIRKLRGELRGKTSDTVCMRGDAVGVLNDRLSDLAGVPPDPGRDPSRPRSASSDSDIAFWIADTIDRYEQCRAQLAAARKANGE